MSEERITWTPANGLNVDDPPIRVRQDQCVEARNILFERGVARTRPYAVRDFYSFWPDPSPSKYRFGRGMLVETDSPQSVVILSDGSLVKGPTAVALTQSGGGTFALASTETDNITVVNGLWIIGNNELQGMVRHDPSTSVFTIVTGAAFRYFTGLYARAVGAWGGQSGSRRAVGWSVSGNETTWSGAGSGETVLAETTDEITGLRNFQNIVVVMRSMGITLGYPTGDSTQPIRWETLIREGRQGCPYPSTICDDGNELFWHGQDNIYQMGDLMSGPTPIGDQIRRETLFWLARGVLFRGFTTRMDYGVPSGGQSFQGGNEELSDPKPRLRYHLVPISRNGVPHYSYDMESKTWGRHYYSLPILGGLEGFNLTTSSTISAVTWNLTLLLDEATQDVLRWGDGASGAGEIRDEPAFIKSGVFVVGDPMHEYKCLRAQIIWARDGSHGVGEPDPPGITLKVRCRQQQRYVEQEATLDAYQVSEASEDWQTTWVDLDGKPVGQLFQISLYIPPAFPMMVAQIQLKLEDAGESKAGHFKQAS